MKSSKKKMILNQKHDSQNQNSHRIEMKNLLLLFQWDFFFCGLKVFGI